MSTLAQMRSRIADDLLRSDLNTQIDKAINRAIEYYYKKEKFWFNQTTGTFATIASQEAYGTADGIPSDILEIDYMQIAFTTTNKPELIPRTYQDLKRRNEGNSTGNPEDYAWYQNKIYLHLIPSTVWTVTVSYRKSYAAMTVDADTNDFTTNAEDLIEARASWWLYSRVLKDYDAATVAKQEEIDSLSALRARTEGITGTGEVYPTGF